MLPRSILPPCRTIARDRMIYYWIKQLHVATVVFSVAFFALRYYWMLRQSPLSRAAWPRHLSVSNDTLLLLAGISLAILSGQYPPQSSWLSAKLIALVIYIVLGSIALKRGKTRRVRTLSGILALICAGYIVAAAIMRSPTPWFAFAR